MKTLGMLVLVMGLLAAVPSAAAGEQAEREGGKGATPYGDSCFGPYGVCKKPLSVHEAVEAMSRYFDKKGLRAEVIDHWGRFIKADVYRGKEKVDCIILDRKSGRMRSIY